jgi:hypothetical protein
MNREQIEKVRQYLVRKGYPSEVLRIDPVFYLMGAIILDWHLFEQFIRDDVPDGKSYAEYFAEQFPGKDKWVVSAFGIDPVEQVANG